MKRTYWIYRNSDCKFQIEKIPIYLERVEEEGTYENGRVLFHSSSQYDEIWGPDVKFEIIWEPVDRISYHHGNRVNQSINMFNTLEIVIINKKTEWIRSHEMTFWFGTRRQIIKKRFYPSNIIHSIMMCESTDRVFELHAIIISALFPNYENLVIDAIKSINCHDI
jgi:hypothetical protein